MFLKGLEIKNFRCFGEIGTKFTFQKGVNLIIGENNSGKSSLIDALRIAFCLGVSNRDIYLSSQDFHINENGIPAEEICIDLEFIELNEDEQAGFYELLVVNGQEYSAQLHIRFRRVMNNNLEKIKTQIWGGEKQGQPVTYETLEIINYYYLGALRDAENDLRPGRGSRIGQLLRKMVENEDEKKAILKHVKTANQRILREPKVQKTGDVINSHLLDIEGSRLSQSINLGLVSPDFIKVTNSLRALLPPNGEKTKAVIPIDHWHKIVIQLPGIEELLKNKFTIINNNAFISIDDITSQEKLEIGEEIFNEILDYVIFFDLDQNGMGYNNIIYMGTVLGDLQELKKIDTCSFNSLLIEEPEAHLHPQLQELVFEFFKRVCSSKDGDQPENSVQVFLTSHSPTLASKADIDSINLLSRETSSQISAIALRDCPLGVNQKEDLKRYLDVTKSQLFFSKGIIFVEGISEALLMPVFADRLNRRLDQNAIEVVNISGTAFEPFANLFNNAQSHLRINIPATIMTDDDRCTRRDDPNKIYDEMAEEDIFIKLPLGFISNRAENAISLSGGNLIIKTAYKTFEYELARNDDNLNLLLSTLATIHPNIVADLRRTFVNINDINLKAVYFWRSCQDVKAVFAQKLAAELSKKDPDGHFIEQFVIPQYIVETIQHVSKVKTN
jgi:putative ATP-dependent endonuclease of OLD family